MMIRYGMIGNYTFDCYSHLFSSSLLFIVDIFIQQRLATEIVRLSDRTQINGLLYATALSKCFNKKRRKRNTRTHTVARIGGTDSFIDSFMRSSFRKLWELWPHFCVCTIHIEKSYQFKCIPSDCKQKQSAPIYKQQNRTHAHTQTHSIIIIVICLRMGNGNVKVTPILKCKIGNRYPSDKLCYHIAASNSENRK